MHYAICIYLLSILSEYFEYLSDKLDEWVATFGFEVWSYDNSQEEDKLASAPSKTKESDSV